jgi:hypothetical protein
MPTAKIPTELVEATAMLARLRRLIKDKKKDQ